MGRWQQTYLLRTALAVIKIFKATMAWWTWEIKSWWRQVDRPLFRIWEVCKDKTSKWVWAQIWVFQQSHNQIQRQLMEAGLIHRFLMCWKCMTIQIPWISNQYFQVASTQEWKLENSWLILLTTSRTVHQQWKGTLIDFRVLMQEHSSIHQVWSRKRQKVRKVKNDRITWWNNTSNSSIPPCMASLEVKLSQSHFTTIFVFLNVTKFQKWEIQTKVNRQCQVKKWNISLTKFCFTSFTICHTKKHSLMLQMSLVQETGSIAKRRSDGFKYKPRKRIKAMVKRENK